MANRFKFYIYDDEASLQTVFKSPHREEYFGLSYSAKKYAKFVVAKKISGSYK